MKPNWLKTILLDQIMHYDAWMCFVFFPDLERIPAFVWPYGRIGHIPVVFFVARPDIHDVYRFYWMANGNQLSMW